MLSKRTQELISTKDETELRAIISNIRPSHPQREEIIRECEERLSMLNLGSAMVEHSELNTGEC